MEQPEYKGWWRWSNPHLAWTGIITLIILFSIFIYLDLTSHSTDIERKDRELARKSQLLAEKDRLYTAAANSRDSSKRILVRIAPYRALADMMSYRDSVASGLPHKVGQIVYIKPDSSKAVIEEILISGNRFESKIKFVVRTKDKEFELFPETIY
jgi:hypothetical protein